MSSKIAYFDCCSGISGDMVLGALIDMLAVPHNAYDLVTGALSALYETNADLIIANHSAAMWNEAFKRAGFISWKTNFFLFLSPGLRQQLEPLRDHAGSFYFLRGDGDGPINVW